MIHTISASICLILGFIFKFLPYLLCMAAALFGVRSTYVCCLVIKQAQSLCEAVEHNMEIHQGKCFTLEKKMRELEASNRSHHRSQESLVSEIEALKKKIKKLSKDTKN